MAISAALLCEGGESIYIIPRSFTSGQYFRRFREVLFTNIIPKSVHLFGSRTDAFNEDNVLQENIILKGTRIDGWTDNKQTITLSASQGTNDLETCYQRDVDLEVVLNRSGKESFLRLPVYEEDEKVISVVEKWAGSFHSYGMEVSTGPVVPFRATEFLTAHNGNGQSVVPLFWMHNVQPMSSIWPVERKGKPQFIEVTQGSAPLLVQDHNYVLIRRFSAKENPRRLTVAPYLAGTFQTTQVGLENHLNYIHRPDSSLTPEESWGLAILLNSWIIDQYFRIINGNT